jgi:Domain of unknown function (DUF4157)
VAGMQAERRNDLGMETIVAGEAKAMKRGPIADLSRALPRVQRDAEGRIVETDPAAMRRLAAPGRSASGGPLLHLAEIQASFGPDHDVGQVRAHGGRVAATAHHAMGAAAYAAGDQVAFAAPPDLRLAGYAVTHVQQRDGVQPNPPTSDGRCRAGGRQHGHRDRGARGCAHVRIPPVTIESET